MSATSGGDVWKRESGASLFLIFAVILTEFQQPLDFQQTLYFWLKNLGPGPFGFTFVKSPDPFP
jgi:hypothetical protein